MPERPHWESHMVSNAQMHPLKCPLLVINGAYLLTKI